MSINLGTTEVELSLYSKALQLATFTVEVPVVGELEPDSVFIGDDMRPCAHATMRARDRDAAARRFRRKGRWSRC